MEKKTRQRARARADARHENPPAVKRNDKTGSQRGKRGESKEYSQKVDPDLTSDFASGWTPYKKVAKSVAEKHNIKKKIGKVKAETFPDSDEDRESNTSKFYSIKTDIKIEPRVDCSDDEHQSQESTSSMTIETTLKHSGRIGEKTCITCGLTVDKEKYSSHIAVCLKKKFQRGSKSEDVDNNLGLDKSQGVKKRFVLCQICQNDISDLSTADQQIHVNDCLDGKPTASKTTVQGASSTATGGGSVDDGEFRCQICGKTLTKMSMKRRTEHINKCIDANAAKDAKADESASTSVPDNNDQNRPRPKQKARRGRTRGRGRGVTTGDRGQVLIPKRLDEPISVLDEQTQLALALSESLHNETVQSPMPEIPVQAQQDKDAFSVLMSPKPKEKPPKKRRGKNAPPIPVPLLISTTVEARARKLEGKVADILPSQESLDVSSTPRFLKSRAQNVTTGESETETTKSSLWAADTSHMIDQVLENNFYVRQLSPQVVPSTVAAGSKIKKMGFIPGWKPLENRAEPVRSPANNKHLNETADQTMFASTQTALILAEMADNLNATVDVTMDESRLRNHNQTVDMSLASRAHARLNRTVQFNLPDGGSLPEETSGIDRRLSAETSVIIENPKVPALESLSSDLATLVGNPAGSDVAMVCREDISVPAHSLLLNTRCPTLIQSVSDSRVYLPSHRKESVEAFLRYVYAGDIDIPTDLVLETKLLAEMFELPLLAKACQQIGRQRASQEDTVESSKDKSSPMSHRLIDRTLQNLLSEVWSSDSDSDSNNSAHDRHSNEVRSGEDDDEQAMDELYEFVASQRKCSNTSGVLESDSSSDSSDEVCDSPKNSAPSSGADFTCINAALMQKLEESFMVDDLKSPPVIAETNFEIGCIPEGDEENDDTDERDCKMEVVQEFSEAEVFRENSEKKERSSPRSNAHELSKVDMEGLELASSMDSILCPAETLKNTAELEENVNICNRKSFRNTSQLKTPPNKRFDSQIEMTPDLFGSPASVDTSQKLDSSPWQREISQDSTLRNGFRQCQDSLDKLNSCITSPADDLFESSLESSIKSDVDILADDSPAKNITPSQKPLEIENSDSIKNAKNDMGNSSGDDDDDIKITGEIKGYKSQVGDYGSPVIGAKHSLASTCNQLNTSVSSHKSTFDPHVMMSDDEECFGDETVNQSQRKRRISKVSPEVNMVKTSKRTRTFEVDDLPSPDRNSLGMAGSSHSLKDASMSEHEDLPDINISGRDNSSELLVDLTEGANDCDNLAVPHTSEQDDTLPDIDDHDRNQSFTMNLSSSESETNGQGLSMDVIQIDGIQDKENLDVLVVKDTEQKTETTRKSDSAELDTEHSPSKNPQADGEELGDIDQENNQEDVWEGYEDLDMMPQDEPFLPSSPDDAGVLHFSMSPPAKIDTPPSHRVDHSSSQQAVEIQVSSLQHPRLSQLTPKSTKIQRIPAGGGNHATPDHSFGEFDPPTDMESDISLALKNADDSILWSTENDPTVEFHKPQIPVSSSAPIGKPKKTKKSNKKWEPPSPFTPMPSYKDMVTPDLKKNCEKIGVRPLPKKKMVALLADVYHKTHQYETDSDYDGSPPPKPVTVAPPSQGASPVLRKPSRGGGRGRGRERGRGKSRSGGPTSTQPSNSQMQRPAKGTRVNSQASQRDLASGESDDLDSSFGSQDSESVPDDLPEESILINDNDVDGGKSQKLSKRDAAYKKQCLWDYIKSHPKLYIMMLHYEVLDFTSFQQQLKDSGLQIGAAVIMDFLDEQNIQFTLKNQQTRQRRQNRYKDKKAKTKKITSTQSR